MDMDRVIRSHSCANSLFTRKERTSRFGYANNIITFGIR